MGVSGCDGGDSCGGAIGADISCGIEVLAALSALYHVVS